MRTLRAYPTSINTNRGIDGTYMMIDEAAFVPDGIFTKVALPVAAQGSTSILAITTPNVADNIFQRMTRLKRLDPETSEPLDEPLFKFVQLRPTCPECAVDESTAQTCMHGAAAITEADSIKSQQKSEAYKQVYYDWGGGEDDYRREFRGDDVVSEANKPFRRELVEELRSLPHVEIKRPPSFIGVGIDPTAGGDGELAAFAAAEYLGGSQGDLPSLVTVCMGSQKVFGDDDKVREFLHEFFRKVRRHPYCGEAPIVVFCEANPPKLANDIARQVAEIEHELGSVTFVSDLKTKDGAEVHGVTITNADKKAVYSSTKGIITRRYLRFSTELFGCGVNRGRVGERHDEYTGDEIKEMFCTQLLRVTRELIPPTRSKPKGDFTFSGKPDDLYMAAGTFLRWETRFFKRDWYPDLIGTIFNRRVKMGLAQRPTRDLF